METFRSGGWEFTCNVASILNTAELDKWPSCRTGNSPPAAVYGKNFLVMERTVTASGGQVETLPTPAHCSAIHTTTFKTTDEMAPASDKVYRFSLDTLYALNGAKLRTDTDNALMRSSRCALDHSEFRPKVPKVIFAEKWREYKEQQRESLGDIDETPAEVDWTFSSNYWGTAEQCNANTPKVFQVFDDTYRGQPLQTMEANELQLPLPLLANREHKILWYKQFDLFEDDLADCGISRSTVRLRVMPTFWFMLLRQEVRVDFVIVRRIDTRLFHEFGSDHVLREFTWAECSFDQLEQRGHDIGPGSEHINNEKSGTDLLVLEDVKFRTMQKILLTPPVIVSGSI